MYIIRSLINFPVLEIRNPFHLQLRTIIIINIQKLAIANQLFAFIIQIDTQYLPSL